MASYVEDNTSQGKGWIFDSGSAVHVCSHKKMFNSLIVKEEGTMVLEYLNFFNKVINELLVIDVKIDGRIRR